MAELFLVLLEEVVDDLDGGLADDVFVVLWNELLVVCGLDFFRYGLGLFRWLFLLLLKALFVEVLELVVFSLKLVVVG